MSQQLQHLDSRQSAQDNNIHVLSEQLSSVQTELKSSVTSIKEDMENMRNQSAQVSSQLSQIPSQISSEISSQFQQFRLLFMQTNQEAVPFPECHTDNNSTGISTLTPLESKDKRGKRKLNTIDHQPLITGSPDQSRKTQEETQMETYDDDDPDLQEL